MALLTPILDSSPSDFWNRTQDSMDWRQWVQSHDSLANETLLAEFYILCQRFPREAVRALRPLLQEEVRSTCALVGQPDFRRASELVTALVTRPRADLATFGPMPSRSSPQIEWSEAITLMCGLYLAMKLVKTVAQGQPQSLIRLKQAQDTIKASLLRITSTLQTQLDSHISLFLAYIGCRRPEVMPDIPRVASPSREYQTLLSQTVFEELQLAQTTKPAPMPTVAGFDDEVQTLKAGADNKSRPMKLQLKAKRKLATSDEEDREASSHRAKRCKREVDKISVETKSTMWKKKVKDAFEEE